MAGVGAGILHCLTSTFKVSRRNFFLDTQSSNKIKEGGKDRAQSLASKTIVPSGFRLGRSVVLGSSRHYLRTQSQRHYYRSAGGERYGRRQQTI